MGHSGKRYGPLGMMGYSTCPVQIAGMCVCMFTLSSSPRDFAGVLQLLPVFTALLGIISLVLEILSCLNRPEYFSSGSHTAAVLTHLNLTALNWSTRSFSGCKQSGFSSTVFQMAAITRRLQTHMREISRHGWNWRWRRISFPSDLRDHARPALWSVNEDRH